ncbi:MAG: hypothetical protein NZM33_17215 [Bryobacteraceae bacterium]|nr:hypothetical protein [Bryobacteraceae bacterium]
MYVSCPEDTNGDGYCDRGGCKEAWAYAEWNNVIALYELDPWYSPPFYCGRDDYVDTLYFPPTYVSLACEPGYCWAAGTGWAARTSSAFTYAEMAMVVNFGVYIDDDYCQSQRFLNPRYNCLW